MSVGKTLRLARILPRTGKTVIVPMDHGISAHFPELVNTRGLVSQFVENGADAVLLRRGSIMKTHDILAGRVGVIYQLGGSTPASSDELVLSSVEEASKMGADAVIYTIVLGHPQENEMLRRFGLVADAAQDAQLPLIGEAYIWDKSPKKNWEMLRDSTRVLSEEGADLVKTYFIGAPSTFKEVIEYSLVPVVAAGGPKVDSPLKLLKFVEDIMKAGACGVAIGRNVWQSKNPGKTVKAISSIVKEDKTAQAALKHLQ